MADEELPKEEAERRAAATLRRMLATPPKHKASARKQTESNPGKGQPKRRQMAARG